ncbi:hypothetical protein NP233_g6526 [Leucocoprinus birnbaumii]|uniref:AAA+ ATPase domain-containing protein n=1 Tax=Leucocoprinus birnbaumii TaxID=56174 RepID=A0AAD5VQV1_9AGAR|nr:hypothetical protein NP233_g6526 [Leucocoprinus birnbaumii]
MRPSFKRNALGPASSNAPAAGATPSPGQESTLTHHRILDSRAHDIVINNPTLINSSQVSVKKNGLDKLLDKSMPQAFHNSASRWPPPRCHYASRQQFRSMIADWGTGCSEVIPQHLLWMHGPFGVGKSAIAQSCAEDLAAGNRLAASLFLSHPNALNDPDLVFTSIAWQLAIAYPVFGEILNREILRDETLLVSRREVQFQGLLVKPLLQLADSSSVEGKVIILDGLDEISDSDAQVDIITIIAASTRQRTTPFKWFILSRPMPHIQRVMQSKDISTLLHALDLPLSPENDHEILTFFTKELEKISQQHNLSPSWYSEADIAALVKLAGGLWVYVNSLTRFISTSDSLGPQHQLCLILSLGHKSSAPRSEAPAPLASIDYFYRLIMQQIPSHVVKTVRKILLLNTVFPPEYTGINHVLQLANVLGLSRDEFRAACGFLQAVLVLVETPRAGAFIHFYHASFMEYMKSDRSGEFCIYGNCVGELQHEVIERINQVHSKSTGRSPTTMVTFPLEPPLDQSVDDLVYLSLIFSLLRLCDHPYCLIAPSVAPKLNELDFSKIPHFLEESQFSVEMFLNYTRFEENLPRGYRKKILRQQFNLFGFHKMPNFASENKPFILGKGKKTLVCWPVKKAKDSIRIVMVTSSLHAVIYC